MAREPPTCCGCVPRRPGLLAWAYIRLVLALTYIGVCVDAFKYEMNNWVYRIEYISRSSDPVAFVLLKYWPLGACLLYLLLAIVFIIGVHRQGYKAFLVLLVYSLFEVMLAGAAVGWQVFVLVDRLLYFRSEYDSKTYDIILQTYIEDPVLYLRLILPILFNMLLPIYFIVLIKSEVQRLKRARREPRVVLDVPVTKEQDKTYNFVYSNGTPDPRPPLFPAEELERLRQQLGVKNV